MSATAPSPPSTAAASASSVVSAVSCASVAPAPDAPAAALRLPLPPSASAPASLAWTAPRLPVELRLLIVAHALNALLAMPWPRPGGALALALVERATVWPVLCVLLRAPRLASEAAVRNLDAQMRAEPFLSAAHRTRRLLVSRFDTYPVFDTHLDRLELSLADVELADDALLASLLARFPHLASLTVFDSPRALEHHWPPALSALTCLCINLDSEQPGSPSALLAGKTSLRRLTLLGPGLHLSWPLCQRIAAQPMLQELVLFLPGGPVDDFDPAFLWDSATLRKVTIVVPVRSAVPDSSIVWIELMLRRLRIQGQQLEICFVVCRLSVSRENTRGRHVDEELGQALTQEREDLSERLRRVTGVDPATDMSTWEADERSIFEWTLACCADGLRFFAPTSNACDGRIFTADPWCAGLDHGRLEAPAQPFILELDGDDCDADAATRAAHAQKIDDHFEMICEVQQWVVPE
jgi:hypothetical protein